MVRKVIRYSKIESEEAEAFFRLLKQIDQETEYMLFLPEERKKNLPMLEQSILNTKENGILLGAWSEEGKLVGFLSAQGNRPQKIAHSVYIVIGILQEFRQQGIGTRLFSLMEEWASEHQIHRLELTVMRENVAGQQLYHKMGFEIEGTKRDAIFMNGRYMDEYYMAKLI